MPAAERYNPNAPVLLTQFPVDMVTAEGEQLFEQISRKEAQNNRAHARHTLKQRCKALIRGIIRVSLPSGLVKAGEGLEPVALVSH